MAKSVSLRTGRAFGTVTAANEHFALILNGRGLKQEFSGDELADIRAVYEDYCAKTAGICNRLPHPSTHVRSWPRLHHSMLWRDLRRWNDW